MNPQVSPSRVALITLFAVACRDDPVSATLAPQSAASTAIAAAPPPYTLIDVSPNDVLSSAAFDIADNGVIIENASIGVRNVALVRKPDGSFVNMGTLQGGCCTTARKINNLGQVVGDVQTPRGVFHAFLWTAALGFRDLGTLGGRQSQATGINSRGEIVGASDVDSPSGVAKAFIWSPQTGVMRPIPTLGGTSSSATDINNAGQVVGGSALPIVGSHAFLWSSSTGIMDLGTLGGSFSVARAINNRGAVVGSAELANGETHAFKWTATTGMVDLGTLNGLDTHAWDINDNGQIVGIAGLALPGGPRAFTIFETGPLVDLGDLAGLGAEARALNRCGQIVGNSVPASGGLRAVAWTRRC